MTVKLPVVGSHVASTKFTHALISGPGGLLHIDGNSKVTAGNGSYDEPQPNAFSLMPGNTHDRAHHCPGSTPTCRASCYVHGLEAAAAETFALYEHNSRMMREVVLVNGAIADDWSTRVAAWITANAAGGFRWHVSGDLFSYDYAVWVASVVAKSPTVRHWIYTRSFAIAGVLARMQNLALNLSCDRDNYEQARQWSQLLGARLCYLTADGDVPADLPAGSVVFPDYPLRARDGVEPIWFQSLPAHQKRMTCPVDLWGKASNRRCGPCSKCLDLPV